MSKTVYDYKILSGDDVSELERQVREYLQLEKGWQLGGPLIKDGGLFYQSIQRVK